MTRLTADQFRAQHVKPQATMTQVLGCKVRLSKPSRPLEVNVEAQIIDELKRRGYWVFRTGQRNAARSGVTSGTPDTYVWRPSWGRPIHCPIEVKRDEKEARRKSRRGSGRKIGTSAQHDLIEARGTFVAWDVESALAAVRQFEKENGLEGRGNDRP